MSGQIFISYRREDSRWSAQSLYGCLCARFDRKQILMDIDAISPGDAFVQAIEKMVSECGVLIAVIGMNWLSSTDEQDARRLDNAQDFARREIATALKRNIRVIPVLVDGAAMPRSIDLPDDLKSLVSRHAIEVSHDRFGADSERLIGEVERALASDAVKPIQRRRWTRLSAGFIAVVVIAVAAIFVYHYSDVRRPDSPKKTVPLKPEVQVTQSSTPEFKDLSYLADVMPLTAVTGLYVPDLGLHIAFITLQQSQSMSGARPPGALVIEVESDGAAAKAGINAGDIVEAIGSQKIDTLDDMRKSFRELGPGKTQFTIRRSDARKTVSVDCPSCDNAITPTPSPIAKATPIPTAQHALPTFFPPKATATVELPLNLSYGALTLEDLSDGISKAMDKAGYERRSYFWLDKEHAPGFAIITHIEQIHADGTPVTTRRWSFDLPSYEHFSIASFLKTMIKADPGNYRMIALVVSQVPFEEQKEPITQDQVSVLNEGPRFLVRTADSEVTITQDYHCIAYVYEFERRTRNDEPVFKDSSDVSASAHLKSTPLWGALTQLR